MSEHVNIEEIADSLKVYVNTNLELIKLELTERVSVLGSSLISNLLVWLVIVLFLFFISLGLAFYLSNLLGNNYSGFIIIAGFYLLIGLILILGKKRLVEKPLRDKIIQELLHKNEN